MEEILSRKLSLDFLYLRKRFLLIRSLRISKSLTSLEQPKDTDSPESLKDSVLENYQEKHTEDLERSDVLDLGIHQEFNGPLPDVVSWVTIRELR